jgi:hypothetical protein
MTPRARKLVLPGLGLLGLLCALAPEARAQDARTVELELRVVYAMKEKGVVDPDCVDLQKRLPMPFGSLQTVQSESFLLAPGDAARFELPTGRPVSLLPISVIGRYLHVQFQMTGIMNTRLQLVSGAPVIVGGERHGVGQLILELTPTFDSLEGPAAPSTAGSKGPTVRRVGGAVSKHSLFPR